MASQYTQPVFIVNRFYDGTLEGNPSTCVVVNKDGWIITVAHLWNSHFAFEQHKKEIANYSKQVQFIKGNQTLSKNKKSKQLKRLKVNPRWITHHAMSWTKKSVQLKDLRVLPEGDLAIGRLDPFEPEWISTYPIFKNPDTLNIGTSLCKLGYPFQNIKVTFNEQSGFEIETKFLPQFPIEGIYTRNILRGKSANGKYDIKLLETSSPGLRGQSGGPIFDTNGTVWAIQSMTATIPLGFKGKVKRKEGVEDEEYQFINVGAGVHPELIFAFMKDSGIKFAISDY